MGTKDGKIADGGTPPKGGAPDVAPQPARAGGDAQRSVLTPRRRRVVLDVLHYLVLVLSVMLILFISYDTFRNIPFLENHVYMRFQLWVCVVFLLDFFIELWLTPKGERKGYWKSKWVYLVLSVPYLSLINLTDLQLGTDSLYVFRFVPLLRGAMALVIVINYITSSRITGLFISYISILVLVVYFGCLIFYQQEQPVNPLVTSYWDAFWWGGAVVTTIGCSVYPVTVTGKILVVVLSFMGEIMFPLFTVYLSSLILKQRSVLKFVNKAKSTSKTPSVQAKAAPSGTPGVGVSGNKS